PRRDLRRHLRRRPAADDRHPARLPAGEHRPPAGPRAGPVRRHPGLLHPVRAARHLRPLAQGESRFLALPALQEGNLQAAEDLYQVGALPVTLFQADNIAINFGGIKAVDGVSFAINKGEVFTIIGPNGAGKTTVFNLISRIYNPTEGRLIFEGRDITSVPPHQIAGMGIARTFQNIELFEHATVLQNLLLGRHAHRGTKPWWEMVFAPHVRKSELAHREKAEHVIDF